MTTPRVLAIGMTLLAQIWSKEGLFHNNMVSLNFGGVRACCMNSGEVMFRAGGERSEKWQIMHSHDGTFFVIPPGESHVAAAHVGPICTYN